jgi:hypothetical protein
VNALIMTGVADIADKSGLSPLPAIVSPEINENTCNSCVSLS